MVGIVNNEAMKEFMDWLKETYPSLYDHYIEESEFFDSNLFFNARRFNEDAGTRFTNYNPSDETSAFYEQMKRHIIENEDKHTWWIL